MGELKPCEFANRCFIFLVKSLRKQPHGFFFRILLCQANEYLLNLFITLEERFSIDTSLL